MCDLDRVDEQVSCISPEREELEKVMDLMKLRRCLACNSLCAIEKAKDKKVYCPYCQTELVEGKDGF